MAFKRIDTVDRLRKVGLKVTPNKEVIVDIVIYTNSLSYGIPVSLVVSLGHYDFVKAGTYNVKNNVIVVVLSNKNVFFVPNVKNYEDILISEGFEKDEGLYVPPISTDALRSIWHRFLWEMALKD